MGDINLGNLYEMNKEAMRKEKPLTNAELTVAYQNIMGYFKDYNNKYFMLLCRERHDYTVFNFTDKKADNLKEAKAAIKDCCRNRGTVLSIEPTEDKIAFEIWLKIEDEPYVYYLFPYDSGMIEV